MGYELACDDVMPGCDAKFTADTEDELLAEASAHAADTHGISELSPEVLANVKAAVKER